MGRRVCKEGGIAEEAHSIAHKVHGGEEEREDGGEEEEDGGSDGKPPLGRINGTTRG